MQGNHFLDDEKLLSFKKNGKGRLIRYQGIIFFMEFNLFNLYNIDGLKKYL